MSDELVFYTNPMSRGRIVRWMLEEVGAPYRTVVLDYGEAMKSRNYLAINPMGKVPTQNQCEASCQCKSGCCVKYWAQICVDKTANEGRWADSCV